MTLTRLIIGLAASSAAAGACPAQSITVQETTPIDLGPVVAPEPDPTLLALNARSREIKQELRKLNHEYFRATNVVERRQIGILRLREYTEPAAFEPMLEVFGSADKEIQRAVIDHLDLLGTDEARSAIAWAAVFGGDENLRAIATDLLLTRFIEDGEVSRATKTVIASGLEQSAELPLTQAANLANMLQLYEAIPMLISAQVGVSNTGDSGGGALGQIWFGTQQAFVSDLTPVVADSAVAFDPTVSVVTDGVILRVMDVSVVSYRTMVHRSLTSLSSRAWGQSTEHLGYNQDAWRTWYNEELLPHLAMQDVREDVIQDSMDEIDRFDW